jgi:hypothetical protein
MRSRLSRANIQRAIPKSLRGFNNLYANPSPHSVLLQDRRSAIRTECFEASLIDPHYQLPEMFALFHSLESLARLSPWETFQNGTELRECDALIHVFEI